MEGSSRWQICRATLADMPALLTMNDAAGGGPGWPESAWRARLGATGSAEAAVFLLKEEPSRIEGWIAGTVLLGVAEIEYLLVRAEWRRQGAGERLAREWMAWSADQGATEVQLEVRVGNAAARGLYERLGFVPQALRPRYYSNPVEDALLMVLPLLQKPTADPSAEPR